MKRLQYHLRHAILIWVCTCAIGTIFVTQASLIGLTFFETLLISLVFSIPAMVALVPNFFIFDFITAIHNRISYGVISVLLVSAIVSAIVLYLARNYPATTAQLLAILIPYAAAAELSLFLIARRFILKLF